MPSPPSTRRKRPQCQTCKSPMAGHKRVQGFPVCPERKPDISSPSPAHTSIPTSQPSTSKELKPCVNPQRTNPIFSSIDIPQEGPFHWRNPNFVDKQNPLFEPPPSPSQSLVPTVLVDDDGRTIRGSVCTIDEEPIARRLEFQPIDSKPPLFSSPLHSLSQTDASLNIFRARREDITHIKDTAALIGVHAEAMHNPSGITSNPISGLARESSWWVVTGQNASFVRQIVDTCQRGMPGTLGTEKEMMEGPRMTTFLQLMIAGIIGGVVVVFGLSLL
ncbi:hypothetical protein BDQ12DRAFT_675805 [Crucibulum laeve]|uniref:Uncharacterized protein n=1 Tax=Crucibulum laeve TaxID=68775 RepID=A0A5C3MET8_9AGAR|nr:hypothetical protein BDQ12DRAFT_675805 [Crucibulum laeve]